MDGCCDERLITPSGIAPAAFALLAVMVAGVWDDDDIFEMEESEMVL